jgi:pSer/pThr/pTyr-binding forkhead associated (FHA) protein
MRRTSAEPPALQFPPYCPQRRFALTGDQLVIGRRNRARGVDPEIDLSGPPLDPGVSTLHAVLLRRDDGGWALVDMGSTNGTVVGDGVTPIPANTPVALADGDRIKIGAWTTLTVTVGPAG